MSVKNGFFGSVISESVTRLYRKQLLPQNPLIYLQYDKK